MLAMCVPPRIPQPGASVDQLSARRRSVETRRLRVLGRLKRQEALYKAARAKEEALAAVARRKEAEARGMAYNLELHAQRILQNTREAFAREEEEREAARLAAAARLEEERCAEADRAQQAQLIKAAKMDLEMHNNAAVLRTIENARRKLIKEEVRLQVQKTFGTAKDLPQLLRMLGYLPNGNLRPLQVHITRAQRLATEQLDPANHSDAKMSYREFCLLAEKFSILSEFSKLQRGSPQRQRLMSRRRDQETEQGIAEASAEAEAYSQGFQNPLYTQDPSIEDSASRLCRQPACFPNSRDERIPKAAVAKSALRSPQGPVIYTQHSETAGSSRPNSPAPPKSSSVPSQNSPPLEVSRFLPTFRRAHTNELFGDSAREDTQKGERQWIAASQRQAPLQNRPASCGSTLSSQTGMGSSCGWKL